ncbi:Proteasome subunit beta [Candidatus Gugararchaeum adminiculabundum]|nr:Proteasome subunit beta [Candidatus Gugararchaeum adminiculabundum]
MDEETLTKKLKTGTTTVGLVCSDGVILASDKRASMGYFIANKEAQKVFKIADNLAMTIAGSVGDAQTLVRLVTAEAQLFRLKNGKPMSVGAATTLLANILQNYKFYPYFVQLLVGGYDEKPRVFNLDMVGGVTEEKFVSTGSGSPMAYGLLEDAYEDNTSVKDSIPLALRALSVAMKRDCASGDGITLFTITKDGVKEYSKDEIATLTSAQKAKKPAQVK